MVAVTARAAKTNFAIWALLRQLLPCLLTSRNLQGMETPRSEPFHTTMTRLLAGVAGEETAGRTRAAGQGRWPAQLDQSRRATLCAQPAGASTPGGMPGPTRCHSTTGNALTLRPAAGRRQRPKSLGRRRQTARDRKAPQPSGERWGKVWKETITHAPRRGTRAASSPAPVPH